MKILLALALAACAGTTAKAPAPKVSEAEAETAYTAKQWAKCGELYDALAAQETEAPRQAAALYNGACCFARDGKADRAFALLDRSIDKGLKNVAHTSQDEDLASLHTDPRWTASIAKIERNVKAWEATLGDAALRRELLALVAEDQQARRSMFANGAQPTPEQIEQLAAIDRKTTATMKAAIAKHGWPGRKLIGADGENAAWLLVQHADADVAFQKECLALLEKSVAAGDADPQHHAYLYDRVAVAEHRPQRYGTQFMDGKPQPIEDEANVDARRKAVGLGTMAEYKQQMEAMYGPAK